MAPSCGAVTVSFNVGFAVAVATAAEDCLSLFPPDDDPQPASTTIAATVAARFHLPIAPPHSVNEPQCRLRSAE
jgi:hypothetical protein